MAKPIIEVKNLSKLYRLGMIGATTLRDSVERWWYRVRGREEMCQKIGAKHLMIEPDDPQAGPEPNTLWALKDISFSVQRGEIIGIIGKNGAGKSTLLKILTRITEPTSGRAVIRGRTSSMLEVGTGFHPELTGRENIYLNGAILGMRKSEIDRKFDEIVDFSGVEKFIDTPVKRYSSGMYVRLAFAVAAHLEPEILLVDEVLAVGDYAFREKSFAHMARVCDMGTAVIFVSHNMSAILTICQRVVWVERGKIHMWGPAEEVVKAYIESQEEIANRQFEEELQRTVCRDNEALYNQMRITKIELLNQNGLVTTSFRRDDNLHVRIHYAASRPIPEPHFVIHVGTQKEVLFVADMLKDDIAPAMIDGEGVIECIFRDLPLLSNRYVVRVFVLGETPIIKIVFPPREVYFAILSDNSTAQQNVMSVIRGSGILELPNEWHW